MARRTTPGPDPSGPQGTDAPWAAFGYLVAGVGFYGLVGWGLSVWLHARYLIAIGIVVGAVLGVYMVWARFGRVPDLPPAPKDRSATRPPAPNAHSTAEEPAAPERSGRPADDRGDTL